MLSSKPPFGLKLSLWLLLALLCIRSFAEAAEQSSAQGRTNASGNAAPTDVVELAAHVVEEDAVQTPWLLARIDGTEVMSRCDRGLTETVINRYQRLNAMLRLLYPAKLQPEHDVPIILLIDEKQTNSASSKRPDQQLRLSGAGILSGNLRNFYRWDEDSRSINFVFNEFDDGSSPITITPAYLRYLLETRSPTLPRWFIEGMVTLQTTTVFPVPPVSERGANVDFRTRLQSRPKYPYDKVTVLPFIWQSPDKTKEMHTLFKRAARATGLMRLPDNFRFLPLAKLLGANSLDELSREDAFIFPYQAALLIRWVLDRQQQEQRKDSALAKLTPEAFWQFVADSAVQAVTAQQFSQTFGQSMTDVEAQLKGYLPFASLDSATFTLKTPDATEFAPPSLAPATALEVSVIKGRSERLETLYVRQFYPEMPELIAESAQRARRTLDRRHSSSHAHPDQLAELGLLEVDIGNDSAARPFLAEAARARVAHPRVYLELARIDYALLLKTEIDWTKPSDEVARIEQTLRTCLEQRPVLPGAYELLFNLWLQQYRPPTPSEFLLLQKAPQLFPRHFRIIYASALLQVTHGNSATARLLVERSLPVFPFGQEHARLVQLQHSIATAAKN